MAAKTVAFAKKMDERGNGTLIDTLEERLMIGEV